MGGDRNERYVAATPNEYTWTLRVRGTAETPQTQFEESLAFLDIVWERLNGFIIPTSVEYVLQYADTDTEFNGRPMSDSLTAVTDTIRDELGVTHAQLVDSIQAHISSGGSSAWLTRVTIEKNRTAVSLGGDEFLLEAESEQYRRPGETADEDDSTNPGQDLFKIELFSLDPFSKSSSDYEVVVWTFTDLWFDDTESAQMNRDRLAAMLSGLTKDLPTVDVEFNSDTLSAETLQTHGELRRLLPEAGSR